MGNSGESALDSNPPRRDGAETGLGTLTRVVDPSPLMRLLRFLAEGPWGVGVLARFVVLLQVCRVGPGFAADPAPGATSAPVSHVLVADGRWLLQSANPRFDASALLRLPDGRLLTVNDKQLPPCSIELGTNGTARLVPQTALFPLESVRSTTPNPRYAPDIEGLARDTEGRLYLCTEGERWIFRTGADGGPVERLAIDWTSVQKWFSPKDGNASWEGIAVGGNRLYLANERSVGRIVVVDLSTLRVTDDFQVAPTGNTRSDVHYSDLSWYAGELWVLCRDLRKVLRVNPESHAVLAEFDFAAIELDPQNAYLSPLPYGFMEGLSVDATHLWLAVDNNGLPRRTSPTDLRPLLFRCPRPDLKGR